MCQSIVRFDVIAGLISRSAIPPGTGSAERFLACIGDEEKFDERLGNYCLPAKPVPAVSSVVKIANFQFLLTNRRSAEIQLLQEYDSHSKSKLIINARYLKIGAKLWLFFTQLTTDTTDIRPAQRSLAGGRLEDVCLSRGRW